MVKMYFFFLIVIFLVGCKSLPPEAEEEKKREFVKEEKLKNYVGQKVNVLYDDFKVESCEPKIAYFKDVFAVKFVLSNEQEIIVILNEKVELSKSEISDGCGNNLIKNSVISKIKFFKNGKELIKQQAH